MNRAPTADGLPWRARSRRRPSDVEVPGGVSTGALDGRGMRTGGIVHAAADSVSGFGFSCVIRREVGRIAGGSPAGRRSLISVAGGTVRQALRLQPSVELARANGDLPKAAITAAIRVVGDVHAGTAGGEHGDGRHREHLTPAAREHDGRGASARRGRVGPYGGRRDQRDRRAAGDGGNRCTTGPGGSRSVTGSGPTRATTDSARASERGLRPGSTGRIRPVAREPRSWNEVTRCAVSLPLTIYRSGVPGPAGAQRPAVAPLR